jgi:hypothetical protein
MEHRDLQLPSEKRVDLLQDRLPLWKLYFRKGLNNVDHLTGATTDQTKKVSGVEEVRSGRTRPELDLPPYLLRHRAFVGSLAKPFIIRPRDNAIQEFLMLQTLLYSPLPTSLTALSCRPSKPYRS